MQIFPILRKTHLCKDDNSFQIHLQIQYNPNKRSTEVFGFLLFSFCFVFQTTLNECQVFRALTPFVNDIILAFSFPMIYFVFSGPYFFQFQRIEFQLLGLKNHSKIKRRKWFFFPCSYRGQQTASFIINTHPCRYYSNK